MEKYFIKKKTRKCLWRRKFRGQQRTTKKKIVWKIRKIYIEEWKIFQWSNPFVYKNDSFFSVWYQGVYWNIWINERYKKQLGKSNNTTTNHTPRCEIWEPNIFVFFFFDIFFSLLFFVILHKTRSGFQLFLFLLGTFVTGEFVEVR